MVRVLTEVGDLLSCVGYVSVIALLEEIELANTGALLESVVKWWCGKIVAEDDT